MRHTTHSDPRLASRRGSGSCITAGRHRAGGGFTLIELLVTIAVAAILMVLAVPAIRTFLQNDRQWTTANSLVMSLNAARSEAIKQDTSVSVCISANAANCGAGTWAQGWIVLSGAAGSTPIMAIAALPTGTTLSEASNLTAVTFLSTGMVSAPAAFTLCDDRGATYARYVQVSLTGSIASSPTVGQDVNGNALTCP